MKNLFEKVIDLSPAQLFNYACELSESELIDLYNDCENKVSELENKKNELKNSYEYDNETGGYWCPDDVRSTEEDLDDMVIRIGQIMTAIDEVSYALYN